LFAPAQRRESYLSACLHPARLATVSAWLVVLFLSGYATLRDPGFDTTGYHPVMAVTLSNQTLGSYSPGHYVPAHTILNAPPVQRFEWTSMPGSHSSIFPLSQLGTNRSR
jgi:hypothetical protein